MLRATHWGHCCILIVRAVQVRALFAEAIDGGNDSITNVRVVRDKATNRGKGIAYVGFKVTSRLAGN